MEKYSRLLDRSREHVYELLLLAKARSEDALKRRIPYELGAKNIHSIDCSGLVSMCYPLLPDGVEKQFQAMARWIFSGEDINYASAGDLLFLADKNRPATPSHIGLVHSVDMMTLQAEIIHASERLGHVSCDKWIINSTYFLGGHIVLGVGKIGPYFFREFLEVEIQKELKDVLSEL